MTNALLTNDRWLADSLLSLALVAAAITLSVFKGEIYLANFPKVYCTILGKHDIVTQCQRKSSII